MNGNPLQCDARLRWLRERETQGRLHWDSADADPECINYNNTAWDQVVLPPDGAGETRLDSSCQNCAQAQGRYVIAC